MDMSPDFLAGSSPLGGGHEIFPWVIGKNELAARNQDIPGIAVAVPTRESLNEFLETLKG